MILKFPKFSLKINLNSSETEKKLKNTKKIRLKINTGGNEDYFETPYLGIKLEKKLRDLTKSGEIIYWCEDNSIAKGVRPAPYSHNENEIRLIAKTNIFDPIKSSELVLNNLKAHNSKLF